jgi:hypothetical protein
VKSQLEAKGKSTEGVETFEEFYGLLQSEAVLLQKKYQPQLRKGIKIAVDLVNSVKQDEVDGDVDVRIRIAPNNLDQKLSFTLENNGRENVENLLKKIILQRDNIFTPMYLNTLSKKGKQGVIDDAMYERYTHFQTTVNVFLDEIKQSLKEMIPVTTSAKQKLVIYEEKLQILNHIKRITEDLMAIHNASTKENKTQVYNERNTHESIGHRNVAFGHHNDLTYKESTVLKANQFISLSGGGNHPKEAINTASKTDLDKIKDDSQKEKIAKAKSIASKYKDILILVPGSITGSDQFREGEEDDRRDDESGQVTERGIQDAERRAFRYFDENLKTGVKTILIDNSEEEISEEEKEQINNNLRATINSNLKIPEEYKDVRFEKELPKATKRFLDTKKTNAANTNLTEEIMLVKGAVSLYSQMTPCNFCAGVRDVLDSNFKGLTIAIKSGVEYNLPKE